MVRVEGTRCDACGMVDCVAVRHKCLVCADFFLCDECVVVGRGSRTHRADHATQAIVPSSYGPSDVDEVDETASSGRFHESRGGGAFSQSGYDTESQLSSVIEFELDFSSDERGVLHACEREVGNPGSRARRRVTRRVQRNSMHGGSISELAEVPSPLVEDERTGNGLDGNEVSSQSSRSSRSAGSASPSSSSLAVDNDSVAPALGSSRQAPSSDSRSKRTSFDTFDALSQLSHIRKLGVNSEGQSDSCASSRKDKAEEKESFSFQEDLEHRMLSSPEMAEVPLAPDHNLDDPNVHHFVGASTSSPRDRLDPISHQRLRMVFVRKLLLSTIPELRD
eukprot:CAMPEP_0184682340 /NCGR_PEP_ID=MMETSP0312-20130426/6773_1 /TAXON_ID=31354 /ORGANISM="Compsopogon coeruleus, Strain SAG 36.94" /LENGTH=335 /DNA_ID=CAMNT_0027133931 /DNA_START=153 /DNA_END=1160 /DNA_ORIENTATION=-